MLTSDKAICEMNTGELAEEYEYCMKSAESEALAPDLQRYFRDRAAAVKSILTKSGQGKRRNSPTIVPIGTAVGTMQRLPTAEDTTMLPENSTITMYQMTSGKPGKRPGKNFSLVFYFVCKILSKSVM